MKKRTKSEKAFIAYAGNWHAVVNLKFWYNTELSLEARSLWLTLYCHVSPHSPNPFPSQKRLCAITGWGKNTPAKYLKELEEKHYLSRHRTNGYGTIYGLFDDPKNWKKLPPMHLEFSNGHSRAVSEEERIA